MDSLLNRLQTKQNHLARGQGSVQAEDASGNPPRTLNQDPLSRSSQFQVLRKTIYWEKDFWHGSVICTETLNGAKRRSPAAVLF